MAPSNKASGTCSTRCVLIITVLLSTLIAMSASKSIFHDLKHLHKQRHLDECEILMDVSAVCYQCAALDPAQFHTIHFDCCKSEGAVRTLCREWYTQEPKRGRRDVWYY